MAIQLSSGARLRCRSLMVSRRFGAPDWLASAAALEQVRGTWREVSPLADWVATHVYSE